MSNPIFIQADNYCVKVFDGTHDTPKPRLNGKPLVTSKHILNCRLDLSTTYNISVEDFNNINKRSKVSQWDVLFSMIGSIGEVYLEQSNNIDYSIKNIGVFSTRDEVKAKWLYFYLKSPYAKAHINNYLAGAVQKFLSLGALRTFPIVDFDKSKEPIVNLLWSIESKIELNNRINAELEAMAKTIYDYWFVQFDFPDEKGRPYKSSGGKMVWSEELKREIPEGWEVKKLDSIANITMGQSPSGSSYNENCKGMIFFQGSSDFGNRSPSVRVYTTEPSRIAHKGDILMSVRAPVGTLNIANNECCIGRGLSAIRSKEKEDRSFLWQTMRLFEAIFNASNNTGTTFGSINKNELHQLKLAYPISKILKEFSKIVDPSYEKQSVINSENLKLGKLRDWLLPMLMNGQVSIR